MDNKFYLTAVAVVAIAVVGVGTAMAHPFAEDTQEDGQAIMDAVQNGDYETWYSLMESTLSEDNFNKLVERHKTMEQVHEAIQNGDYGTAKTLMEESGFDSHGMHGPGMHAGCPFADLAP